MARVEPSAGKLADFSERFSVDQIDAPALRTDIERFATWNEVLKERIPGRETVFVDLDAIDHNLKLVGGALGDDVHLRFVAKSLPCLALLEYMMQRTRTNRVMAFAEGMVRDLLHRFGHDVDILLGRPAAVASARRVFAALDDRTTNRNPAGNVRWLLDTHDRVVEYADLAEERAETIHVAIEIDLGLGRGGARNSADLLEMLEVVDRAPRLQFAGFMGYDGHVPFLQGYGSQGEAFDEVRSRYASLVEAAKNGYPHLFYDRRGGPVLNSGGSRTFYHFGRGATPVDDVAVGSIFCFPSNFHDVTSGAGGAALRSAVFFATPVLKQVDLPEPHGTTAGQAAAGDLTVANFLTTGDFPGEQVFPRDLARNRRGNQDQTRIINLLPNQARWLSPRGSLGLGDFVFYEPWESDALRWLRYVDVFRGGELVDQWEGFQPGSRL